MSDDRDNKTQISLCSPAIPLWAYTLTTNSKVQDGSIGCSDRSYKDTLSRSCAKPLNILALIFENTKDWESGRSINIWIPQTL